MIDYRKVYRNYPQILCFGLLTNLPGDVTIDHEYRLYQNPNENSVFVCPKDFKGEVDFSIASFYADCIAFEQDVATLAVPAAKYITRESVPWVFKPADREDLLELYLKYFFESFDVSVIASDGIWYMPYPNYDLDEEESLLFKDHYLKVSLAIHVYNAAMRQSDPLSQYLHYYRVFENISNNNGKRLIEELLATELDYELAAYASPIRSRTIVPPSKALAAGVYREVRKGRLHGEGHLINMIEVRRAEALYSLKQLKKRNLMDSAIADRLYKENRCGIAHGKTIKRHDMGSDFTEIVRDLKLLRYLARLAIERSL
jgi:hypothetical protein